MSKAWDKFFSKQRKWTWYWPGRGRMVYGLGSGKKGDFFPSVGKIIGETGMTDDSGPHFPISERGSDGMAK